MAHELSLPAIQRALKTGLLGNSVLFYEQITSTNDVALRQAVAGAGEGLLVVAEEQTSGRGRQQRSWWAPPGSSLLMSLLLRPHLPPRQAGQLTMCLGLGAAEGVEETTGLRAMLKWPNDLLLGNRKLGGMLTELRVEGERVEYAVLGLGLNVNLDVNAPGAPPELAATATSLQMSLGRAVDRLSLLAAVLARCEVWYRRLSAGYSPHEAWTARLDTLGQRVRVTMSQDMVLEGIATGVSPEGALLVHGDDGTPHVIWSGDVVRARAQ